MDPMPDRWWTDTDFLKALFRLVAKGFTLIAIAYGGSAGVVGLADGDLRTQEAKAGVNATESYRDFNDLATFMTHRSAACDTALEMFARHRDDDRDWTHVLEACHSDGEISP